jgi:hypothetical protein
MRRPVEVQGIWGIRCGIFSIWRVGCRVRVRSCGLGVRGYAFIWQVELCRKWDFRAIGSKWCVKDCGFLRWRRCLIDLAEWGGRVRRGSRRECWSELGRMGGFENLRLI